MQFPNLLSPLEAGRLKLKNRVVFPAHQTLLSEEGVVGPRMRAYYAERARGGVAAVMVEGGAVHDTTIKFPNYLFTHRPEMLPSLIALNEELSQHGCKTIVQLVHSGGRMSSHDSRLPLWAPSDVRSAISPEIPHAMTTAEIESVLEGYEASFKNVAESGVAGLEIHSAHEYLLGQFLSPLNNLRTDEYGGELENRIRLLSEVVMLARKTVGDDVIVGVRINGSDLVEGSLDSADYVEVAQHLEALAAVDYLSISAGTSRHNHLIVPPMDTEEGLYVDYAAAIRDAVTLPVMAVGRLKRPELAEQVIADGRADVVAEARALIADPFWVAKLAEDAPEQIRPCIGCNQGCFGYLYTNRPITCAVNPAVGHERTIGIGTESPGSGRRVLVVGAGPAGMEAAISAAQRGNVVTIAEAGPSVGGQLPLAASLETRAELATIVHFQKSELERLGVELSLNERVDLAAVQRHGAEAVIVATGSEPRPEPIDSDGSIAFAAPIEIMSAPQEWAGKHVVIFDVVANMAAYAPAEALLHAGATVTLATPKLYFGSGLDMATMTTAIRRLARLGASLEANSVVLWIADGSVHLRDTMTGEERTERADAVVAAVGNRAVDTLAHEIEAGLPSVEVHLVGDAAAPRTVLEAIREGRTAGRAV